MGLSIPSVVTVPGMIPLRNVPLDAWLLKLSDAMEGSGNGIASLGAQITDLETRCIALRSHSAETSALAK